MKLLLFSKKILFLVSLAILLIGYIWYFSPEKQAEREKQQGQVQIFTEFNQDVISKIAVKKKDDEVVLVKDNNQWFVEYGAAERYPILQIYLDNAFKVLKELKAGDVVSLNKENYESFDLTEEKAVAVNFYQDALEQPVYEIYIGKAGPVYPSSYLRIKERDEVILVSQALRVLLDRGKSGWRDKTVLKIARADAESYTFSIPSKGKFALALENNEWQVKYPVAVRADQYLADRLFNTAGELTAADFVLQNESQDLKKLGLAEGRESLRVAFKLKDGQEKILLVGKKDEGLYYARVIGNNIIYKIGSEIEIFTKQDVEKLRSKE